MKKLFISALFGFAGLAAVNLTSAFTGLELPVSRLSLAISATLGLPGVIAMLLMKFIA